MMKITYAGGNAAGDASHLAVQGFSSTEILTAIQNGSGDLELIGWTYNDGTMTRAPARATAGTANEVALALLGRRAVTAVRSGSNKLLLISWDAPTGLQSITRLQPERPGEAGEASNIAITAINSTTFVTAPLVTALRDGSGDLLLICWALNADGTFTRLGDSNPAGKPKQAGAVSLVTITPVGNNIVVTAVRNGSGNLELIAWRISEDYTTIHRLNPVGETAGTVGEIALTTFRDAETGQAGRVVTAVQNGAGDLLLIAWKFDGTGFQRLGDTSTLPVNQRPGTASHISISPAGNAAGTFLTTMRRGSGDLELIAFTLDKNGGWIREADFGEREGTDVTETVVSSFWGRAVSATRRAGFLNVSVWEVSTVQVTNTTAINQWITSVLADPARAHELKRNWMKLLKAELPLSNQQSESLALIAENDAKKLRAAVAMVVDNGGTIHIERKTQHSAGTLILQPKSLGNKTAELSVTVFHCTFNAHCRDWHCGWGPVRK
ncbi:MAG TPA: hypothetical protein VGM65_04390 [Candidatus Udaeobacter sp.]|jgi:hypothetical protein